MPYIGVSPQFGVRRKHTYTATAGQTSFSGAGSEGATLSYTDSNFVDVYQNGVKLGDADYTSTSGTAIVLAQGASVDDLVEIIVFDAFSAADTVSKADGGTFDGNVTMDGNLTVSGAFTSQGIDDNANATAITINSSETVMIGRTSTGYSNTGAQFTASGAQNIFVADGDFPLGLNRQTDDGVILDVRKDGTTVGSVNSASGDLHIGTGDAGLRFYDAGPAIYPRDTSGNDEDGTVDLGLSSARFKDIYLSGGVNFSANSNASGMTSELLDDYEEGTWTPVYSAGTNPTVSYNTQDGKYTKIGQTVAFNCRLATNSTSGGSGSVYITGLPFANSKISAGAVVGAYWTGETPMKFRVVSSSLFLYYRSSLTSNDLNNNTQTNDFNTSGSGGNLVEITGVYFTDS